MAKITFINDTSLESLEESLKNQESQSLIVLSCDGNNYEIEKLDLVLKKIDTPLIGGIFPQIIYKNQNYEQGAVVIGLESNLEIHLIEELSQKKESLDDEIEEIIGELDESIKTMYAFVDGLTKNINEFIAALFENFGLTLNYIGGGAGSLSFEQKPVIFTNEGVKQDCAVLGLSKQGSNLGVKHGWYSISDVLLVTKSEANELIELNYKPAFEVYKEVVESISGLEFNDDNFFDIAKGYPLGIIKASGESVVRDPIMTVDNKLVCVGDVAVNSSVNILKGDLESLTNAAKNAAQEARVQESDFTLFIDCISRVLFLEEDFTKELDVVYEENKNLVGALTLGEIANNKKHYLEFYNKTSVVGNIEK